MSVLPNFCWHKLPSLPLPGELWKTPTKSSSLYQHPDGKRQKVTENHQANSPFTALEPCLPAVCTCACAGAPEAYQVQVNCRGRPSWYCSHTLHPLQLRVCDIPLLDCALTRGRELYPHLSAPLGVVPVTKHPHVFGEPKSFRCTLNIRLLVCLTTEFTFFSNHKILVSPVHFSEPGLLRMN